MKKILMSLLVLSFLGCASNSVTNQQSLVASNVSAREIASTPNDETCGLLFGIQSTVSIFISQLSRDIIAPETNVSRYATIYYSREFYANEILKVFIPRVKENKESQAFLAKVAVSLGKQDTYSGTQKEWSVISKKVADDLMKLNSVISEKRKSLECKI